MNRSGLGDGLGRQLRGIHREAQDGDRIEWDGGSADHGGDGGRHLGGRGGTERDGGSHGIGGRGWEGEGGAGEGRGGWGGAGGGGNDGRGGGGARLRSAHNDEVSFVLLTWNCRHFLILHVGSLHFVGAVLVFQLFHRERTAEEDLVMSKYSLVLCLAAKQEAGCLHL